MKPDLTLLQYCDAARVSAARLAEAVGVSRAAVYRWSNRLDRPGDDRIRAIARTLRITLRELDAVLAPEGRNGRPRKH